MREYSTREVADIAGLPPEQIRRWARAGLLAQHKSEHGRWRFSFQDLALLRTARKLIDAQLSLNRVTKTLRLLRDQLPPGRPLSAVRVLVTGRRIVVKDRLASWEPETRQGTLDFDVRTLSEQVAPKIGHHSRWPSAREPDSAAGFYELALDLELAARAEEAKEAYRAALELDPELVSARINLGRLLHAEKCVVEAEALYRAALQQEPGNAMAAFNLGVALEDQGQTDAAIEAYSRAVAVDDGYADAHFNLSRLFESKGDERAALRHLSSFRRLMNKKGSDPFSS